MAADLQTKPGQPKYDAFVDTQLARVRTRIRALDAGRSLMLLGIVTLAYFLAMAVFDLAVKGADDALLTGIRLTAFTVYAVLMAWLLTRLGASLYRRINPYYAAKRLEDQIPDAKNSVINWLDLRGRELPGAIRNAVGQRAARELRQADPDKAVNPGSNWLLGGILSALAIGLLILFALGPNQFGSLWRRAFAPFLGTAIGNRTEITLIRPANGDVTVPLGQRVDFQAQIEGRFPRAGRPGAPRVLYRYQQSDAFVPLLLEEAADGTWNALMLGDQVQGGFWYKVAAGDKETPEYQVKVRSLPQAMKFEATYHHRPYRILADTKIVFPNEQAILPFLREYRGTQVTLVVRTNRELRTARVEVNQGDVKKDHPAEVLADDPKALRVQLTLEQRGTFRIGFTSKEGEENIDRSPYVLEVLDDLAPNVVLSKPGQDASLPLGGTLKLEGAAQDDIGIKAMALRLKVLEGESKPELKPKIYREGKSFCFDDGTYPDALDYKDFIVFDKLPTAQGEWLTVKPDMVFEYWLEATDNSDYPNKGGNIGKSQSFKLRIQDRPKDEQKQKEDQKKAQEEQQKHEQKQDQNNSKENKNRKDNAGQGNDNQNKESNGKEKSDETKKNDDLRNNVEKKAEDLRKQLDKDDGQNNKDQTKDQQPKADEGKGSEKGKEKNDAGKDAKGADQGGDKGDGKQKESDPTAGQAKDKGPTDKSEQKPGDAKGADNDKSKATPGADAKDGDKAVSKTGSKDQPPNAKDKGGDGAKAESGNDKGTPEQLPDPKEAAKGKEGTDNVAGKANAQKSPSGKKDGNDQGTAAKANEPKEGDLEKAKSTGTAKNDTTPKTDPRDATKENVTDLKDLAQKKNDKDARDALERIAKDAKDPGVREAAKEALDKLGDQAKTEPQPKEKKGGDGATQTKSKDGDGQDGPKQAGKGNGPKKGEDKIEGPGDGSPKQATGDPKNDAQSSNSGPGGKGFEDDVPGKDPNVDFAKRRGELQLEDLKKRMTPETLKKLGWSPEEWQQFLKDAEAYNALQRRDQAAAKTQMKKGSASQIPNQAVRQGDRQNDGAIDPLFTDRALPPPEFREAQQRFTTNPPGKK